MKNKIIDQMFEHRSVRSFDTDFTIPREDLNLIVEAGQRAATSCSGQMYTVIEISKEKRDEIFPLCGSQDFVKQASYFSVICVDLHRLHKIVELSGGTNQNWPMAGLMIGIFDAGLMAQNMALAAESMGYDTCFCGSCGDRPDEIAKALNLPPMVMPLTGLAIGRGAEDPPTRPRLQTSLVHHLDTYKEYGDDELNEGIDKMDKQLQQEGYYQKYSEKELGFGWRDHVATKFGGKWLNTIERRRLQVLKDQKFMR